MTHDILPSDVDLANKLRSAGHSDEEIITSLVHRGIVRAEAMQLLDDLREGRPIKTKIPQGLENAPRKRSRERRSESSEPRERVPETEPSAPAPAKTSRRRRESKSAPEKKRFRFWPWVIVVLVGGAAALGGLAYFNHRQSSDDGKRRSWFGKPASARERADVSDAEPETVAARELIAPSNLALELRAGGLHLGETRLTRDNALKAVSDLLGAPSRTIPGKEPGTMNYAFDAHGLVICCGEDGANNCILLDCDAVGGATGTKSGFQGWLRAEGGEIIRADTAFRTLAAIKKMGFKSAGIGSGILDGRYQDLNLVFVYLKSPNRLSAVEIDFK